MLGEEDDQKSSSQKDVLVVTERGLCVCVWLTGVTGTDRKIPQLAAALAATGNLNSCHLCLPFSPLGRTGGI